MKTKHTKGRWSVVAEVNLPELYVSSEYHGGICSLPKYYGDLETAEGIAEAEANAKLIAAAPELLEALQVATLYVSSISNKEDWNLIQAAIKKATE